MSMTMIDSLSLVQDTAEIACIQLAACCAAQVLPAFSWWSAHLLSLQPACVPPQHQAGACVCLQPVAQRCQRHPQTDAKVVLVLVLLYNSVPKNAVSLDEDIGTPAPCNKVTAGPSYASHRSERRFAQKAVAANTKIA
jgi:hypothetical protein